MADDTRLADACLLLNYSNQSYKEQKLLSKRTQQPNYNMDVETDEDGCSAENMRSSNSLQLDSEMTASNPRESSFGDSYITLSTSGNIVSPNENPSYSNQENEVAEVLVSGSIQQDNSPTRDRIDDLFAAVNCALPELKSYTTSSSASSPHTNIKLISCSKHLPDHDYCMQGQVLSNIMSPSTDSRGAYSSATEMSGHEVKNETSGAINFGILSRTRFKKQQQEEYSEIPSMVPARKPLKLVAIHLGAGQAHNEAESLNLAKKFCEEVMLQLPTSQSQCSNSKRRRRSPCGSNLRDNPLLPTDARIKTTAPEQVNAETAVVRLIKLMEDHQSLNCGFGSNLNMKGQVECDASMMSDLSQMWAGIGSVSGCRNPILLVKSLYDARTIPRNLGLIQPNLLVGSGAKQWMREHCPHLSIMDSKMISARAFSTYQKLKSRYDNSLRIGIQDDDNITTTVDGSSIIIDDYNMAISARLSDKDVRSDDGRSRSFDLDHGFYCAKVGQNLKKHVRFAQSACNSEPEDSPSDSTNGMNLQNLQLDTVGAVAVDCDNNFASAISSGGLLLKYKGRVGQAAIPGAGCWSENSMAITTTGVGEYLTLSLFAKRVYEKMQTLRLLYDLGHVEKKPDQSNIISSTVDECFEDLVKSPALAHVPANERLAGLLAVSALNSRDSPHRVEENDLYLSYAHNTRSMCLGYMTCDDIVGHSIMSCQTDGAGTKGDSSIVVKTLKISLESSNRCTAIEQE